MEVFLEEELTEGLILQEIDKQKDLLAEALEDFRKSAQSKRIFDIVETIQKLSELKVEVKVAKAILKKHWQG